MSHLQFGMRLSPLSQPHAVACRRGHALVCAAPRAACNPRQQLQPATISMSRCWLVAQVRCSRSGDMEGGSRSKEAGDSPVPRASGQQQAVELLSSLLQDSLNSQQQTQALVRVLMERQHAHGQEAAAHQQPDQLRALIAAALAGQNAEMVKALSGLTGALQEQQARQEARHQQLLEVLTRLVEQQQQQGQQQEALQRQEGLLRQVLDAVSRQKAQEAQPPAVAEVAPAASEVVVRPEKGTRQQERIELLDYVRVVKDMDDDTMPNGTEGLVLVSEVGGRHFKVWSLDDPSRCGWLWDFQLERIPDEGFPKTAIPIPSDGDTCGVPVTRFTAAPGMLVRKGSYVHLDALQMALFTEVGVIRPSYGMGDKCLVMWGSGWEEEYCTGKGNCFELVHLEVSPTSGAPVVGEWTPYTMIKKQLGSKLEEFKRPWHLLGPPREFETEGGVAVERGTHWTYGRADPGVGILNTEDGSSTQPRQRGLLPVRWPDGQLVHHRASPIDGYDLCYSARPGDPVTLFTARQGLRVEMGVGVRGTLDKPLRLRDHSVEWNVISDENVAGRRYHDYLIMSHGSERLLNEWQDQGSSPGQDGSPLSGTLEFAELQ